MTVGRIIQGRYRLLSKLGQGGMGEVWRGEHIGLGTPVAIKLLHPTVIDSKSATARFKREAQAAASLRGSNVVQLLDYGVDEDSPYIVMELLEGESLSARLSRRAPLAPGETAHLLGQVGRAVARAHSLSIVHRDLKPDNIFIVRDGDEEVAKVLDFGIAKTLSKATFELSIQTKSGAILGTPHYMSPEQASGRAAVDHRSDIWSFGILAFECLTGYRPFNGSTLGSLVLAICSEPIPDPSSVASVPRGFDDWFRRCVARDPTQRFQSMLDAVAALRSVCEPMNPLGASSDLEGEVREPTLQASIRGPALQAAQTRQSSQEHPESVSASARTLATIRRHRSSTAYVALAVVVLGGLVLGAFRLHATLVPVEPRALDSLATAIDTAAPPFDPTLALSSTAVVPAVAASVASARSPRVVASSGELPRIIVVPVDVKGADQGARDRTSAKSASSTRAKLASDHPVGLRSADAGAERSAPLPSPEPANRPDPRVDDDENTRRGRTLEDRLAF